jgi:type I restriction-modification system DNA methylase subunit
MADPQELSKELARTVLDLAELPTTKTEEDVRIGVEKALGPVLTKLGINIAGEYERTVLGGGRQDAVYGKVIIEYEPPRSFKYPRNVDHCQKQLRDYLLASTKAYAYDRVEALKKLIGVGLDGSKIFFLRFTDRLRQADLPSLGFLPFAPQLNLFKVEGIKGGFQRLAPYPVTPETMAAFLLYLRAVRRRPLEATKLADEFGPRSDTASAMVSALYSRLSKTGDPKVQTFFGEWKIIFGVVYGEEIQKAEKAANELAADYRIQEKVQLKPFLFCIHTYYALLMKLLAFEFASLQELSFVSSPVADLPALTASEVKEKLENLEDSGGTFDALGIKNFLEGDFFSWYLRVWDEDLADAIKRVARGIADFEPGTVSLEPAFTRDLLKKLYQYLLPRKIRHDLGEYYTPDWLAERVLTQIGYDGDLSKRLLDPSCGSGTFLTLAIRRARQYVLDHIAEYPERREVGRKILTNIVGFDLNPLAVIAARTNYLLAFADYLRDVRPIEIPVYICDSILTPTRYVQKSEMFECEDYELKTIVGKFHVPAEIVDRNAVHFLAEELEKAVKGTTSEEGFLKRVTDRVPLPHDPCRQLLRKLLADLKTLETYERNGLWARFLKNAFAPIFQNRPRKFDFVVGNPPWVNWESLAQEYRDATKKLWTEYGLFSLKGHEAQLGGGKKDIAMLFVYACMDNYLEDRRKLGFVLTQTLFKSKGAGDGFRRFKLGDKQPIRVIAVDDFSDFQPFDGATNRTSVAIFQKGLPTGRQVPYTIWRKKPKAKISLDMSLDEVREATTTNDYVASPVDSAEPSSPWITLRKSTLIAVAKAKGPSIYKGAEGSNTLGANGVYWLRLKEKRPDDVWVVENLSDIGDRTVKQVCEPLEEDLIYPLLRGRDVDTWIARPAQYILMVQDPAEREGYDEKWLEQHYPCSHAYLKKFEAILESRAGYRKYFCKQVEDPQTGQKKLVPEAPFYSMYNIAESILSPFKVIWREQASLLTAAVVGSDERLTKAVIPDHKLMYVPMNSEEEAHYLCALLSSSTAKLIAKSYTIETSTSTHVLQHIAVPKFDPSIRIHERLSEFSRQAHTLRAALAEAVKEAEDNTPENLFAEPRPSIRRGEGASKRPKETIEKELAAVSQSINQAAADLWRITKSELEAIDRALAEFSRAKANR